MRASLKAMVVLLALAGAGPGTADDNVDFVIIVSADNPVRALPAHALADIYLGRRTRFPDGRRAEPVDYRDGSSATDAFYREILGRSAPQLRAHWSRLLFTGRGRAPHQVGSAEELIEWIAAQPNAIGYVAADTVDDSVRIVQLQR